MPVQRNTQKAQATRVAAQDFARQNLKLDFPDIAAWRELAAARGLNLPAWYVTSTGSRLQKYADRIGLSIRDVTDATGCRSFAALARLNPTWPLFAVVGLLLEMAAERTFTPVPRQSQRADAAAHAKAQLSARENLCRVMMRAISSKRREHQLHRLA
jgi:hypothetical protein